jgi:hypothetical protein
MHVFADATLVLLFFLDLGIHSDVLSFNYLLCKPMKPDSAVSTSTHSGAASGRTHQGALQLADTITSEPWRLQLGLSV